MGQVFLSHCSADTEVAAQLSERLKAHGYRSAFLDFHPEDGIPAGRDWELELYRQLRSCQALIVLCSAASMESKWCFAEITHARSQGKAVLPVIIDACDPGPLLLRQQTIDWRSNQDAGFDRLVRGLKAAGLDPANAYAWDGSRSPYPGLLAFQEADAAVYFGRDKAIQAGLEKLNVQHQFGGNRSLMILGPSGSGKSSLVRAGLLPRLRADTEKWLVLPPVRPGGRPLRELAVSIATACGEASVQHTWRSVEASLASESDDGKSGAAALAEVLWELRAATADPNAHVVLVIDQAEELITGDRDTGQFVELLLASQQRADFPLQLIWTLRSDFLGAFQVHPALRHIRAEDLRIGPLDVADVSRVIEGPAALAGLQLEVGLVQLMLHDMATDDALPLLAFMLRTLYERSGEDGKLTVGAYRDLGGISGAVARAAEHAFEAAHLFGHQEHTLRAAFMSLVRIDDEGHYTRRRASEQDVGHEATPWLERFVQARLLVASTAENERFFEVAHEALFASWGRLKSWLDEGRDYLLWLRRLERMAEDWAAGGRREDDLLRGEALSSAREILEARDAKSRSLSKVALTFLGDSILESRRQSRMRLMLIGVVALTVVTGFGALWIFFSYLLPIHVATRRDIGADVDSYTGFFAAIGEWIVRSWVLGVLIGSSVFFWRRRLPGWFVRIAAWILAPALSLGVLLSTVIILIGLADVLTHYQKLSAEMIKDQVMAPDGVERAIARGDLTSAKFIAERATNRAGSMKISGQHLAVLHTRLAEVEALRGNAQAASRQYCQALKALRSVEGLPEHRQSWTSMVENSRTRFAPGVELQGCGDEP